MINGGYPETPDNYIERRDDCGPDPEDEAHDSDDEALQAWRESDARNLPEI